MNEVCVESVIDHQLKELVWEPAQVGALRPGSVLSHPVRVRVSRPGDRKVAKRDLDTNPTIRRVDLQSVFRPMEPG